MSRRLIAFLISILLIFALTVPTFASSSDNGDTIVYRTQTGECYHRYGCSYLRRSCFEITLREAVENGLRPCSRCSPPRYNGAETTKSSTSNNGEKNSFVSTPVDTSQKETFPSIPEPPVVTWEEATTKATSAPVSKQEAPQKTYEKQPDTPAVTLAESKTEKENHAVYMVLYILCAVVFAFAVILFINYSALKRQLRAEQNRSSELERNLNEKERNFQSEQSRASTLQLSLDKEKEERFASEKQAFLVGLNGRSLIEAAAVPKYIKFKDGYPVDNGSMYGSFTVYRSTNGHCYHDRRNCCSARIPIHYFEAKETLTPCSKCCTSTREIPDWYFDYQMLRSYAEKYQVECMERDPSKSDVSSCVPMDLKL